MNINWKKTTILFIAGQSLTLFGSMVVQYAIMWHIMLTTQSGAMVTLVTIVGFLPMFLISPFGGVWADRFNRKALIVISDSAVALASLVVAVILIFGNIHISILLVCAAIRALGQGVQSPAVGAVIPQIVPEDKLIKVNGIYGSVQSFCTLAAPMLSAALMSFASLEYLFMLDVVSAAIGISMLIFFVKVPDLKKTSHAATADLPAENTAATDNTDADLPAASSKGYFGELKEGIKYIKNHEFVVRLLIFQAIFLVFISPSALLTPLQVIRNFGDDVWRLSAIEVAFSVGMIAGGLLIASWGGFKNKIYTMSLGCLAFGLVTIGLGISPIFWLYITFMGLAGITMPLFNTPAMVLIQSTVKTEFMGRVISVFTMVSTSIMPLSMLLYGPVADTVNIDIILIVTGIVMALMSIPLAVNRILNKYGKN